MRFSVFFLLISSVFLFSCSSPPHKEELAEATLIHGDFSKVLEINYRGTFVSDKDDAYFQACGSKTKLPVKTSHSLRNIYQQISSSPKKSVYIEFVGEIIFPQESNSGIDAEMRIDRVHHMSAAKRSLKCEKNNDAFHFKASGESPYWRLSIDGNNLYFANNLNNKAYTVETSDFRTTQINTVLAINEKNEKIKLTIRPNHCYEKEKKEYWGYSAQVDSTTGRFIGCGEPGWPTIDEAFEGFYLNSNDSAVTNLTLKKDHRVEYKQTLLGNISTKTGYWKSNTPGKVIVMLTKEGDKVIREEFVFSREGLTLTTNKVNRDNILTEFSHTGFVFDKMNAQNGEIADQDATAYYTPSFSPQDINPSSEADHRVQQAVLQYFKINRTDPKQTKFTSVLYDINNDGYKDAFVFLDWCSNKGCMMLIFKGTKNGYDFSSNISRMQAPITISKKQHYLWQSLLINKNDKNYTMDFDGMSYPIHTRSLKEVPKADVATDVILFSKGLPKNWFLIKK